MTTRFVRYAMAVATAAALAGCDETAQDEQDTYGSLATAITATGTDGATYRLPADTYVQVYNGSYYDFYSMDGDMEVLSIEVPVGDYLVSIGHPNGYTVDWPLDRTNPDATTETVNGTLLTPQPVSVSVTEGATSSLVFQFQVVDGGTVTFAHGLIDISVDVSVETSTVGRATWSGTYNKISEEFGATAPPALADLVHDVGTDVFHQVTVNVVGDWVQTSSNSACSTATLLGGAVSASYYDLTVEAWTRPGATVRLCVYGGDYPPMVNVWTQTSGPAITSSFAALGASDYYIYQSMTAYLTTPVFDGTTLDLAAMTGTFTVSGNMYSYVYAIPSGGSSYELWYDDWNEASSMSFQFVPTL